MEKNLCELLYTEENVPTVLDKWCAPMLTNHNPITRLKAKRLLKYWGLLTDKAFFDKRIQLVFNTLYSELNRAFPELIYEFSGRIKGLVSAVNKLDEIESYTINSLILEFITRKLEESGKSPNDTVAFNSIRSKLTSSTENPTKDEFVNFLVNYKFEKNPFDRVRDFFAFRLVIEDFEGTEGEGYIDILYEVVNFIIEFFNKSTFEVIASAPLLETGNLKVQSPLIIVPEKTGLKKEFVPLCKDYVLHPKNDGYQSVHFVVYDPYSDRYFEFQIRTRSMDIIAETLANHENYKSKRYSSQQQSTAEKLDLSKIKNMKGFRYFEYIDPISGEKKFYISDRAGITQSIPIRLEFEHFLTMF